MTDELHSCGFHCTRPACVASRAREWEEQRRRIAELEAKSDALRAALDAYRGQLDRYGKNSAADAIDAAKVE